MEYDEIMGARLSALEARIGALEQRQAALERGGTATPKRRKKELSPEERVAIRARLEAGKERKRQEREAEIKAEAEAQSVHAQNENKGKATKRGKKEAKNGASSGAN
jgi:hypothetical protein